MNRPTNYDDIIDSRDVIEAIDELRAEIDMQSRATEIEVADAALFEAEEAGDSETAIAQAIHLANLRAEAEAHADDIAELQAELDALVKLAEEAEDYAADWKHGETLIRDSYFRDYAEELADDCGMVDRKVASQWPYTCIDWDQAARDLQMDYTSVDFGGITYWIR